MLVYRLHQLLMRCQALLIQLLHNGWRYQEQSAISQAELLANDLSAVGFYRLAHVLGQILVIQKARHG